MPELRAGGLNLSGGSGMSGAADENAKGSEGAGLQLLRLQQTKLLHRDENEL